MENSVGQRRKRVQTHLNNSEDGQTTTIGPNASGGGSEQPASSFLKIQIPPAQATALATDNPTQSAAASRSRNSSSSSSSAVVVTAATASANLLDEFTIRMASDRLGGNVATTTNQTRTIKDEEEETKMMMMTTEQRPEITDTIVEMEQDTTMEVDNDCELPVSSGGNVSSSIASLTSIGSTANALYSSLGNALNSITSPITAAAAAATATTAEAAAVVVAAASAISNHLSSPTIISAPSLRTITGVVGVGGGGADDDDDDEDDCEDNGNGEEEVEEDDDDDDNNCDMDGGEESRRMRHPSSACKTMPAQRIKKEKEKEKTTKTTKKKKKSWSEITEMVNQIRKQLSCLSSMVPTNIQFRQTSENVTRCYFLATPPNAWESTMLYIDIRHNKKPSPAMKRVTSSPDDRGGGGGEQRMIGGDVESETLTLCPNSITGDNNNQQQPVIRLKWKNALQQPISGLMGSTSGAGGNAGGGATWSREFQLLQERKRLSTWGITSYEIHKSSGKIVFPRFNDLYQCLDNGYDSGPMFPIQLRTCPQWAALDPQICPHNSDLIAYISGCDIWVTHTLSGHEQRLTFAHDGRRSFADDPLSAGVPSYVMQEEFSRYQGFWWQPDSDDKYYRIVYEEVDESDVCLYTFPSAHALPGEMEEYRFPRTGTANAKSKLKMIQFILCESLHIVNVCIKDLPYSLSVVAPWMEYIVRVGWTTNSKHVWLQAMDRKQQRLDIILIPVDNFCETFSNSASSPGLSADNSWNNSYCQSISPIQFIYSQRSSTWINVHDILHFLDVNDKSITFIWASEETGHRHLYLITTSLQSSNESVNNHELNELNASELANNNNSSGVLVSVNGGEFQIQVGADEASLIRDPRLPNDGRNNYSEYLDSGTLEPRILSKIALTSGNWEVLGRNIWIDSSRELVYFLGLRETPLEKHLYVVGLRQPNVIRLLTEPGSSYVVELDESCEFMFQVYCNIHQLPTSKIVQISHSPANSDDVVVSDVNSIQLSTIGYVIEGLKPNPQYCPQIYSPRLPSGEIVYAMVFKPHHFQNGIKYPAVLNVYGGPEVQIVKNTFRGKHYLRMHMLAAQGYCVICIDSRGSRHRGTQFEAHIRGRMGQVEMRDQVYALKELCRELQYIDMNRIAIHGWSYGGYLSLMGLVHYPSIFKMAIAGAPVTNWEFYDTGYTERYMDLPANNTSGYFAGSILNHIHLFPDEENRLLLIHGLVDENVHFYHTSQLINALNKANKPYALHIFPNERHSLRNLESNKNYETKLLSFLQNL